MNPLIVDLIKGQITGLNVTIAMFEGQRATALQSIGDAEREIATATARREELVNLLPVDAEEN